MSEEVARLGLIVDANGAVQAVDNFNSRIDKTIAKSDAVIDKLKQQDVVLQKFSESTTSAAVAQDQAAQSAADHQRQLAALYDTYKDGAITEAEFLKRAEGIEFKVKILNRATQEAAGGFDSLRAAQVQWIADASRGNAVANAATTATTRETAALKDQGQSLRALASQWFVISDAERKGYEISLKNTGQLERFRQVQQQLIAEEQQAIQVENQLAAAKEKTAGATTRAGVSIRSLRSPLSTLSAQMLGLNPSLAQFSGILGTLAVGSSLMIGVLAGLTVLVTIYTKLTQGQREARGEADKLTQSLLDQAKAQHANTLEGQYAILTQARANVEAARSDLQKANLAAGGAAGIGGTVLGFIKGGDAAKRYADAVAAASIAERNLREAHKGESFDAFKFLGELGAVRNKEAKEEEARIKKLSDAQKKAQKEYRDELEKTAKFAEEQEEKAYARSVTTAVAILAQKEAERKNRAIELGLDPSQIKNDVEKINGDINNAAKEAGERQKQVVENLIRSMQSAFSDFFVNVFNGGVGSFKKLFDSVKQLYLKMVADLLAAKIVVKIFGDSATIGGQQLAAGNIMQTASLNMLTAANIIAGKTTPPGAPPATGAAATPSPLFGGIAAGAAGFGVGYGIGRTTTNTGLGALGGAAGGAITGAAIGSVIPGLGTAVGAVIGGLSGLVGGFLGAGKAAAEAAKQLREMRRAAEESLAQFKQQAQGYTTLDERIQQAAREAGQERARQAAAHPDDVVYYQGHDTGLAKPGSELERIYAEIAQAQQEYVARLKEEAKLKNQQYAEDLQVRLLRAQGHDKEADALALKLQQQRELAALDEQIRQGLADEGTRALLLQVQAAELLKKSVDALTTSVRNAPSGFKIESYVQQFATPRERPFMAPPISTPYNPERPSFPTSNVPSQTSQTRSSVTFDFTGSNITIDAKDKTSKQAFSEWSGEFLDLATKTVGINANRAEVLDFLKRGGTS